MAGSTRRSALKRGLLFLAGLAGLGAAGKGALAAADSGDRSRARAGVPTQLVLYGHNWHGDSHGRRRGELPLAGDRITAHGDLLDRPDGAPVGEFYAAAFALGGPGGFHRVDAERLELHTFKLRDGTIVGTGTAGRLEGVFAILGGTGRYAGARGTYVARQRHHEFGGDGAAEFVLTFIA